MDGAGDLIEVVALSTDVSLAGVVVDGATVCVALKIVNIGYVTSRPQLPTLDIALLPAAAGASCGSTRVRDGAAGVLLTGEAAAGTTTLVA